MEQHRFAEKHEQLHANRCLTSCREYVTLLRVTGLDRANVWCVPGSQATNAVVATQPHLALAGRKDVNVSASTIPESDATPAESSLPFGVLVMPPPSDLPYDDGARMESPWHAHSAMLLKDSYVAAHGGLMTDYYIGVNMFVYYSWKQIRDNEYRGPDLYVVKNVDGTKPRLYWATWDEDGRYPDVIIELLSPSTEQEDLGAKKDLYEQHFRTPEYFCIAPEVERLSGWRLGADLRYQALMPDEHGRLWSEELGCWIGSWRGVYLGEEHTWPRLFHPDGTLVLVSAEVERERANAERKRADALAARLAAMEEELARLRAGSDV